MRLVGPGHPCLILVRDAATGKPEAVGEACDAREVSGAGDINGDLLLLPPAEITHRQLIEACALSGIVTAICTRGATLKETLRAAGWHQLAFRAGAATGPQGRLVLSGGGRLILVHGGDNLHALERITSLTFAPTGYEGPHAALAVAAGALLLIVDDRKRATEVRAAEAAMGNGQLPQQADHSGRRAITAARNLQAGHTLTAADLCFEPGRQGMAPWQAEQLAGRKLLRDVAKGEALQTDQLDGQEPEPPPWFAPRPPRTKP